MRVCIAQAGLESEVEFVNHDFKRVWTEEWRKHQPFNQMPYLLDNETGYNLYESRAIAKCACRRTGGGRNAARD